MKKSNIIFFVAQTYAKVANAGSKPSADFEVVLRRNGAQNIGLKGMFVKSGKLWWFMNWVSSRIALLRMPKSSILVFQYPEQRHLDVLIKSAVENRNKIIILIHDINELRGFPNNHPEWLQKADVVIAHSAEMKHWLKENYCLTKVVELGIFDYITVKNSQTNILLSKRPTVVFAGRLDKSFFITELCVLNPNIDFIFFGPGFPKSLECLSNAFYKGVCLPDELPSRLAEYNFGLVWDGNSVNECDGPTGNYVRYNSPYKISSYLAAGIPVLVWRKMAAADFVLKNNIGLALSSLTNLSTEIAALTPIEYQQMRNSVNEISLKLINGEFYENALKNALNIIQ